MKKLLTYLVFILFAYLCFYIVLLRYESKKVKTNYKVIANDRGIITTYDTIKVTKQ